MITQPKTIWTPEVRAAILAIAVLSASASRGQTTVPVYNVLGSGATAAQAGTLASGLQLPSGSYSSANGQISFLDPINYIRVPTTTLTDVVVLSNALAATVNRNPAIPLTVEVIDWETLTNWTPLDSNGAINLTVNVLSAAGLTPQFGSPAVTHTTMSWSYSNEFNALITNSQPLDTEVVYQFTEPGGHPLMGPGELVRLAYQPANSNCTQLIYAARQLQAGPLVSIFGASEASNRAAAFYAGLHAQITAQLVYYCPPLSFSGVSSIIPHYLCGGTASVTNENTGTVATVNLLQKMIPATDDPAYVPSLALTASFDTAGQVVASVAVTGGRPPYVVEWNGSNPDLSGRGGTNIAYTPEKLVAPLLLAPSLNAAGQLVISWFDPTDNLALQSSPSLSSPAWQPDTHVVTTTEGTKAITDDLATTAGGSKFYRLTYQTAPEAESVRARVTDANGISSTANQVIMVNRQPVTLNNTPPGPGTAGSGWGWGTESPWYTGDNNLGAQDTDIWRQEMNGCGAAAGPERFDWQDANASRQDYYTSWNGNKGQAEIRGVDTASLVFHVGHGDPDTALFNPGPNLTDSDKPLPHSWGDHGLGLKSQLSWLGFLACNLMQNKSGVQNMPLAPCEERWGPAFDGLHLMLGFTTVAQTESGFPGHFADQLLNCAGGPALPVQKAWFAAAAESYAQGFANVGQAAAMSPIMNVVNGNKVSQATDIGDYYWGRGPVGPSVTWQNIKGFVFLSQ